jgi:predicted nucleotidyltransferase
MWTKICCVETQRVHIVPEEWAGVDNVPCPELAEMVQMLEAALNFSAQRLDKTVDDVALLIRSGNESANSTFRYALSKELSNYFKNYSGVRNLYVYGSTMVDQARLTSDINLILHVHENKKEYECLMVLLDDGMTCLFREKFNLGAGFMTLLNCHVVTDEEISRRAGYGAMLYPVQPQLTCLS